MTRKALDLRRFICVFNCIAIAVLLPALLEAGPVPAPTATASVPELVLSPAETNNIGIPGWPDSNISAFRLNQIYYLFASNANNGATQAITTTNVDSLSKTHQVIKISALPKGGKGAFDHDYAGGGAVYYAESSGVLIQLYHGEFWYGGGSVSWLPAYTSLGLAVSTDLGKSWRKLGQVISASARREHRCQVDIGNGSLNLRSDGYLYAYYSDMSAPCEDVGIGLARARLSDIVQAAKSRSKLPNSGQIFMKYYKGIFDQPGVLDPAKPTLGGGLFTPMFTYGDGGWPTMSSVAYDVAIHQYVMTYVAGWDQNNETGIALRFSGDGLRWSPPAIFNLGKTAFYPSLLNVPGGDPNSLGDRFYIYYVYPFPGIEKQNLMRVTITLK